MVEDSPRAVGGRRSGLTWLLKNPDPRTWFTEHRTWFKRTELERYIKLDVSGGPSAELYYEKHREPEDRTKFRTSVRQGIEDTHYAALSLAKAANSGDLRDLDDSTSHAIKKLFKIDDNDLNIDHVKILGRMLYEADQHSKYEEIKVKITDNLGIRSNGNVYTSGRFSDGTEKDSVAYKYRKNELTVRMDSKSALDPKRGPGAFIEAIAGIVRQPSEREGHNVREGFRNALRDTSNFSAFAATLRESRERRDLDYQKSLDRQNAEHNLAQKIISLKNEALVPSVFEQKRDEIIAEMRKSLFENKAALTPDSERAIRNGVSGLGYNASGLSETDFNKLAKVIFDKKDESVGVEKDKVSFLSDPVKYFKAQIDGVSQNSNINDRIVAADILRKEISDARQQGHLNEQATHSVMGELDRVSPPQSARFAPPPPRMNQPYGTWSAAHGHGPNAFYPQQTLGGGYGYANSASHSQPTNQWNGQAQQQNYAVQPPNGYPNSASYPRTTNQWNGQAQPQNYAVQPPNGYPNSASYPQPANQWNAQAQPQNYAVQPPNRYPNSASYPQPANQWNGQAQPQNYAVQPPNGYPNPRTANQWNGQAQQQTYVVQPPNGYGSLPPSQPYNGQYTQPPLQPFNGQGQQMPAPYSAPFQQQPMQQGRGNLFNRQPQSRVQGYGG